MILNYFLLALRNVRKQRGYAIINTLGLAMGLASALFIFLYVRHERTYTHSVPLQIKHTGLAILFNLKTDKAKIIQPPQPAGTTTLKILYSGIQGSPALLPPACLPVSSSKKLTRSY